MNHKITTEGQTMTTRNHIASSEDLEGLTSEEIELLKSKFDPLTEEEYSILKNGKFDKYCEYKRMWETLGLLFKNDSDLDEIESLMREIGEKAGLVAEEEDKSVAQLVKEWIESTHGWWDSQQMYRDLQLNDTRHKKTAYMAIIREMEKGLIERHRSINGRFRKIENETVIIDYKNANPTPIDIEWPLDINNFFITYRHNVMVVSGTPDAGKTAFFYDFIKRNQNSAKKIFGLPIRYYGSEATPENMHVRLSKHEDMSLEDWDFEARMIVGQNACNFAHLVNPNACTIIDYIDLNENLYEIGSILRDIYDKLDKGIVLAGIQKPFNRDMGFGKEFAMKIPTLYVSIEGGNAKILKCKDRTDDERSPEGKILKYKLFGGWKFYPQTAWHIPEDDPFARKKFS